MRLPVFRVGLLGSQVTLAAFLARLVVAIVAVVWAGAAAADGGKLYAVGGVNGSILATVEEYDPATNAWTPKESMPTARYGLGLAAASNGKLYAVGGYNGNYLATVQEYDPATDVWTTKASMPTSARGFLALAAASNGKLYAVGGWNGSSPVGTVQEYDPATNAWTTKAPMPAPRYLLALAAASNGKLYAVGGYNNGILATVEEYDPATNAWTSKASMSAARYAPGLAAASNGKLYAAGGWNEGGPVATVEEYDPATNVWTVKEPLPAPRYAPGLAPGSNGRLYAVGGWNGSHLATAAEYDPATNTWASKASMPGGGRYLLGLASFSPPTATAVVSSANPSTVGQPVTFRALVSASAGGVPTGDVTFKNGGGELDTVALGTLGVGPSISAGGAHTCAVTAAGGAQCWGYNRYGQLGVTDNNNTSNPNPNPLNVTGLSSGVIGIAAGDVHTCAVTEPGGVKCWGRNEFGQLGVTENNTPNPTPVNVTNLASGVDAIAAGLLHVCALTETGGVKCWGANDYGQLGVAANPDANPTPINVTDLSSGVIAIASGHKHTCALTEAGGVKCWGNNQYGQLGVTANGGVNPTPVNVTGLSGAIAIAAGAYHTCALTNTGGVKCWGYNEFGQLGVTTNNGNALPNSTPVGVTDLSSGVIAIKAGNLHTCAVISDGSVKCWGINLWGQLGFTANNNANPTPTAVAGLSGAIAVAGGGSHSCGLTKSGSIKCWGFNGNGELGNETNSGEIAANPAPLDVDGLTAALIAKAKLVIDTLSVGGHNITADYLGDTNHSASSDALVQQVDPIQTSTGLDSSNPSSAFGESVTFTATVTSGAGTPAGTVSFRDDDIQFGSDDLDAGGVATFDTAGLSVGSHTITAFYLGGGDHAGSTSDPLEQTVSDEVAPVVTVPDDIDVPTDPGVATAVVTYIVSATDDVDGDVTPNLVDGLASGSTFPLGPTTVTYNATDAAGNVSESKSFTVTVYDREAPGITSHDHIVVETDPGLATAVVSYTVSATDNVDGAITPVLTAGLPSGSAFPLGVTTVSHEATDAAGNTASASFTVTVTDQEAPVITVPADFTVATDPGLDTAVVEYAVSATDNVDGPVEVTLTAGLASGEAFPLGETLVTYEATDAAGNEPASESFTVTVTDAPTLGNRLLAVGGIGDDGTILSRVEAYDPATDTWTDKASMAPRQGHGLAAASNGKLYAVGGYNGNYLASVEEYDPATDVWTAKAPMPTGPRWGLALAAASNGKLYAVGGNNGSGVVRTVEEYDPATNAWTPKAPMPTARELLGLMAASNGKLYAVGGTNGSFLATVEEYDPATDVWTTKASMLSIRYAPGLAAASNGKLYAVGGYDGSFVLATVEEYDPATDVWTPKASMATPRYQLGLAAASNGKLYAVGGVNNAGNVAATVEEYNPATDAWAPKTDLATARRVFGLASFAAPPLARVGYYELCGGEGFPQQADAITAAGETPVLLTNLTAADLADIDVAFVTNGDNGGFSCGGEWIPNLPAIQTAVENGVVLVFHDRNVQSAAANIPGASATTFVRNFERDTDVDVVNNSTSVTSGPGGIIGNTTLDDGTSSNHGYAQAGTLPAGSLNILSNGISTQSVTFSYPLGSGRVIYSSIPLDYYLLGGGPPSVNTAMLNYAANVVAYAAGRAPATAAAETTLTADPNPSTVNETVTFTATVTPADGGTPTGTVTFYDGATNLGSDTLDESGVAAFDISTLTPGDHIITAEYGGDGSFAGSISNAVTQVVQKFATSTLLASAPNPSTLNQTVTFTATVSSEGGTPTGPVSFQEGGYEIGSSDLDDDGVATFDISTLTLGDHIITAVYGGDSSFATSNSTDVTQTVEKFATSTALAATPNPSTLGESVTFTATVSASESGDGDASPASEPEGDTPTGTVTFWEGYTELGTGDLDGTGTATFSTSSLAVGNHTITAVYGGDTSFATSTSPAITQAVDKAATTTIVTSVPNPSLPGQSLRFTATVTPQPPATGTPTGSVAFKKGAATLATRALSAGQAIFDTTALTIGQHVISAVYSGAATFAPSTSTVTVNIDPRVGPEFRVNSAITNAQQQPSLARLADGGFVVVWESNAQDGSGWGVYGQRHNAAGTRVGGEFRVNTRVAGNQSQASVVGLVGGGFVVVWTSDGQDGSGLGVYAQRYNAVGAKVEAEFRVNTTTTNAQSLPSLAALKDGGFVVAWASNGQDGSGLGIYGRFYNTAGVLKSSEFPVNTKTVNSQTQPFVAALAGGGFVVAWASDGQDGSGLGVYGQRYSPGGTSVGVEFRVNTTTPGAQFQPSIAALNNGGFVVVWESSGQDGSGLGVYGQRFNFAALRQGGEFRVNTAVASHQHQPSVAGFPNSGFVVTWTSSGQDGSLSGVYGQNYSAAGAPVDVEFRINTTITKNQWQSSVGTLSAGNFVGAWTSRDQDASLEGVYAQRFNHLR